VKFQGHEIPVSSTYLDEAKLFWGCLTDGLLKVHRVYSTGEYLRTVSILDGSKREGEKESSRHSRCAKYLVTESRVLYILATSCLKCFKIKKNL